jgi:hypothetical protein
VTSAERDEAGAILDLCEGSKHKAFAMVEGQLAVLVLRTQLLATLRAGIELRDRKSRFLRAALALFIAGFTLYCVAIAQLLAR